MADLYSSITSANAILYITVPELYPQGFQVVNFSADAMFTNEAVDRSERQFGADGYFNVGYIFTEKTMTITLTGSSPSIPNFVNWLAVQDAGKTVLRCNAKVTLPGLKIEYDFVDGVIASAPVAQSSGKVLTEYTITLAFRDCKPAKI